MSFSGIISELSLLQYRCYLENPHLTLQVLFLPSPFVLAPWKEGVTLEVTPGVTAGRMQSFRTLKGEHMLLYPECWHALFTFAEGQRS